MIYDIIHRTAYTYQTEASFSQHLLRLTPRTSAEQTAIATEITVTPEPEALERDIDMFGNIEHLATVRESHDALEVVARSRVERRAPQELIAEASAPWEVARDAALGVRQFPAMTAAPFAFPTAMTDADIAIEEYARRSLTPGRPVLAAAHELTERIYHDFEYAPGVTDAETPPAEAFAAGKGVCQDFAHVMLAALRAYRVPSRYVSGYLRTIPPEGEERLQGADASHAWIAVWDPVFGWVEFDPTNNALPGQDHIALAWGRDYADVAPVSGLVIGAGAQTLRVSVDVAPAGAESFTGV
jgi:transglutaminase-like putative cysteine protease